MLLKHMMLLTVYNIMYFMHKSLISSYEYSHTLVAGYNCIL